MTRALLIDAKHLLYRSYYSSENRANDINEPVRNFMRILVQAARQLGPIEPPITLCWDPPDSGAKRKEMYPEYKAERLEKATPERLADKAEMAKCQKLLVRVLSMFGYEQLESPGWEADDTLATVATGLEEAGRPCIIVTGDRDLLSCASQLVTIARPVPGSAVEFKIETPQTVMDRWSVEPKRFVEMKALMGDTSDNIPGAKGIGEKKAMAILKEFGTASHAVSRALDVEDSFPLSPSIRKSLVESAEAVRLSWQLASIYHYAPLQYATHSLPKQKAEARLQLSEKSYALCGFVERDLFQPLYQLGA